MPDQLTVFDKIHLAECAAKRANENFMDEDRFLREYATAMLWRSHRTNNYRTLNGELLNYKDLY